MSITGEETKDVKANPKPEHPKSAPKRAHSSQVTLKSDPASAFKAKAMKKVESLKPFPACEIYYVDFDLKDSLYCDYVDELTSAVLANVPPTMVLDEKEVRRTINEYYSYLLYARIEYVNDQPLPQRPQDELWINTGFFSMILEQVGRVTLIKEKGYDLIPRFIKHWENAGNEDSEDVTAEAPSWASLTKDALRVWLRDSQRKLMRWFSAARIQFGKVLPRSKEGDVDFMTMQIAKQEVLHEDSGPHGLYAVCAAVVGMHQTLRATFDIHYGNFQALRQAIQMATDVEVSHGDS